MAKRKRQAVQQSEPAVAPVVNKKPKPTKEAKPSKASTPSSTAAVSETIQIVVGSYDHVLHGLTATIVAEDKVDFADTFLFSAHTSAIRCMAVSPVSAPIPGQTQKVLLASGSTDERINVYNLSAYPPNRKNQAMLAKIAPRPILENSKNRELGTLMHHASTVTALRFPTRSKLLSSSEDSTIAVTRTRDWSLLSNIKAPIAKAIGRPSGDTAPFGGTPSGINDFAIHPSMKLMISVSKGERSMRLWNLVTGKKAGVLNFTRDMLQDAGEGKHSTGEGRRVVWGNADGVDEFCVGFERDIVVFGMDSVPKCRVMPTTTTATSRTKIHQFFYVLVDEAEDTRLLAVATEDGRILFFSTKTDDLSHPEETKDKKTPLPVAKLVGQLGGVDGGVSGRIKDFVVINSASDPTKLYVAGASSDGKVRLWAVTGKELTAKKKAATGPIGKLLGTYETQNRITCMAAFLMIPRPEGVEDSEDELDEGAEESCRLEAFEALVVLVLRTSRGYPPVGLKQLDTLPRAHKHKNWYQYHLCITPGLANMADDSPHILRPIPRRPFDLSFTSATPPDEDSSPATPAPQEWSNPRFLNPTPDPISSLSRPQSFLNLTSSTLFGIYSPTASSGRDRVFGDRDDADTPWGTGAQTPIKRPSVDEATYELMRSRSHLTRRRSSFRPVESSSSPSAISTAVSLALRATLLFLLGVGYGVLVTTRFHGEQKPSSYSGGHVRQGYNWSHLLFWGVAGVGLGALLPWVDRVWEDSFGDGDEEAVIEQDGAHTKEPNPSTDWALVVRAIGAFVGIVFAIRKVAWASTLQVSLTLALVNPFLWWLIDRSKPGLLLSTAVGLTGSVLLLGVNPDMMPAPSGPPFRNGSTVAAAAADEEVLTLGGLARQETVEAGVWMLSVLFCSCVCFGNIGRRLALGRSAAGRGRWAGVR
ncbi:hypothetical protein G7046_g6766 [Stylonectria norvegica]|nr:hypothetical protein G7046_g6766 [Stylonectria norvegica]